MNERRDELDALLARRTLEGLDADEVRRLEDLLAANPQVDAEWVDRIVGEIDAATVDDRAHPLDASLRRALLDAARSEGRGELQVKSGSGPGLDTRHEGGRRAPGGTAGWVRWSGWGMAAVLAGLLALQGPDAATSGTGAGAEAARTASATEQAPTFEAVAERGDAVVASWTPGGHASGDAVVGEVVWSGARQEGVMRFAGLEANPTGLQYQLWIFDAGRDERFPVDGGVFDVPGEADVVEVPIDARLPVDRPTLFAVTLEPAGGVVVSDRTRLATVATVVD